MRKLTIAIGFATLILFSGQGLVTAAGAVPGGLAPGATRSADLTPLTEVKGRGHAFGHRKHGNRGLHRGWRLGRGNPHR